MNIEILRQGDRVRITRGYYKGKMATVGEEANTNDYTNNYWVRIDDERFPDQVFGRRSLHLVEPSIETSADNVPSASTENDR